MTKKKSLITNFLYNLIKTFSNLVFPIITFSYSARILGDVGIGRVNFAKSIVSYFAMFAIMGMNYYGTREAAKLRDDREKLSKYVQEMLIVNACTTLIAYILLFVTVLTVGKLKGYESLLLLCSLTIALQGMGMEWLYQGLEEYKYIAMRSVGFQVCALAAMFMFVRDQNDVIPYAAITLFASSGSHVANFIHARQYVIFRRFPKYEIRKHLKPILWLFTMTVSIELYTVLDSTMLGFIRGDAAVGRYAAAVKMTRMVNSLITSVGVVLIPRLSYYVGRGEDEKVQDLVRQAFNYVFMLSIPAAAGLFVLSDEIILLFSGSGFASAGLTMRILTATVVVIPVSIVVNLQIFVPKAKEKLILYSTSAGAVTNFICNMCLIPKYGENGAAVATVIAETVVTGICILNLKKYFDLKEIFRCYWQYWMAMVAMFIAAIPLHGIQTHYVLRTVIMVTTLSCIYFAMLRILKNKYLMEAVRIVASRMTRRKKQKNP